MTKFTRVLTVLAAAGAFAPLAANAATVGTSMYAPGPIIVHAPVHHRDAAAGRTARVLQMQAIRKNT